VGIIANSNIGGFFFLAVQLKIVICFYFVAACSPVIVRFRLSTGAVRQRYRTGIVAPIGSFFSYFSRHV